MVRRLFPALVAMTALLFAASAVALAVGVGDQDGSGQATGKTAADCAVSPGTVSVATAVLGCVGRSLAFIETPLGTGSGILVEGGYVVTNAHVVVPFAAADVTFGPGRKHQGVAVKGVDLTADLALLGPVDITERPLAITDAAGVVKGDEVFLVGYPGEVDDEPEATISKGILSRSREAEEFGLTFLQTDAAIGGGQSGGALVDADGQVMGISGYSFAEEFALALSGEDVRRSIDQMLDGKLPPYRPFPESGLASSGTVQLDDEEAFQVLTLRTGEVDQKVRLKLPPETRPAVLVSDLAGEDVFFQNREALEAMAAGAGVDVGELDGEEADSPVAPGVFEFEVPKDTYAVIIVGTRRSEGATMTFETNTPVGRYDDADDDRPMRLGDRLEGVVDGLESADSFLVALESGEEVEIFAGSATGDMGFSIRGPGMSAEDEILVDDSDTGLFRVDAKDTFKAEVSGEHKITVFSADGEAAGYVLTINSH